MDFDKCQKKYCPVNKKELNIQKKELYNRNEKCKKLFTDYSKKQLKKPWRVIKGLIEIWKK